MGVLTAQFSRVSSAYLPAGSLVSTGVPRFEIGRPNRNWKGSFNDLGTFADAFNTWNSTSVTFNINSQVSPSGATDADAIMQVGGVFASHFLTASTVTYLDNTTIKQSVIVKPIGNLKYIRIQGKLKNGSTFPYANFSLINGTVISTLSCTSDIIVKANGYYECSITYSVGAGAAQSMMYLFMLNDSYATAFTGVSSDGIAVWQASQEVVPRIEVGRSNRGWAVLVEETTTNDFGGASNTFNTWTPTGITSNADSQIAPSGDMDADAIMQTSANSMHYIMTSPVNYANNTVITQSVSMKSIGGLKYVRLQGKLKDGVTYPICNFNLTTGVAGSLTGCTASIYPEENGYYRCSITYNIGSGASQPVLFIVQLDDSWNSTFVGNTSKGVALWRSQQEAKAYLTNWYPGTRNSEYLSLSTPLPNLSSGTVCLWTQCRSRYASATFNLFTHMYGGAYKDYIILRKPGNNWGLLISDHDSADSTIGPHRQEIQTINTAADGDWVHLAITWSAAAVALYVNGVKKGEILNPPIPSVNGAINIGSTATGFHCNSLISDVQMFSYPLTDQQLSNVYNDIKVGVDPAIVFPFNAVLQSLELIPVGVELEDNSYLIDMTVYKPDTTIETVRVCSGSGCRNGGFYYEPRISDAGSIRRMLFSNGTTSGKSEVGVGNITLLNPDGKFDYLLDCGLDGRSIMIKQLIAGAAVLLMGCTMEQPFVTTSEVTVQVKDPMAALDLPVQANKYGGTNNLPGGTDGTSDIKGKEKPLVFGSVFNITPECVNTSKLIYQPSGDAIQSVPNVFDKGVKLTLSALSPYSSSAEMEANEPNPGEYRVWPAGGCFRLGASPAGQITCDVVEGATSADRKVGQVAKRIALKRLTSGDLNASTFDLAALNVDEVGIYITGNTKVSEALDQVLGSKGGWFAFDVNSKLSVGQLVAPAGTPTATFTPIEILEIEKIPINDEGNGVPPTSVTLDYMKNWTVQDAGSLAGRISTGSWEPSTLYTSSYVYGAAFGNGLFIILESNTYNYYTSPDGKNWTARIFSAPPRGGTWVMVLYGGGKFVIVGNMGDTLVSSDGITWSSASTIPTGAGWTTGCYGNGMFIVMDRTGGHAAKSTDGVTWNTYNLPATIDWRSVVWGGDKFVAVAFSTTGLTPFPATTTYAYSTDGVTWNTGTLPAALRSNSVAYGNGMFIIITSNSATYYTSPDGITWTQRTLPSSYNWVGPAYGDGVFMLVSNTSNSNVTLFSDDGITWKQVSVPAAYAWVSSAYGNGMFLVQSSGLYSVLLGLYHITPSSEHKAFVKTEYRNVLASDSTVLTKHKLAPNLKVSSLLIDATAAGSEASRRLDLYKVRRDFISVTYKYKSANVIPDLGSVVKVTYPRFGYDSGKLFVVLGIETSFRTNEVILYLWG